ncbi:hypothetical protein [Microbacterium sp. A84]|uniref:hypothetical protein n=1 Tax=Microbacterium sp. A84 TaxID=3450715 RepID=UPI003F44517C
MSHQVKTRMLWADLPEGIHAECARILGGPVVSTVSQAGGFSPGSADRVSTADGQRAFVKAVRRDHNSGAFELHAREIDVMSALPAEVSAPRLLGSWIVDDWVALILDDVEARHPGAALDGSDTVAVLDAFATLPVVSGSALASLPRATDEFTAERDSWLAIAADDSGADLPQWVMGMRERLQDTASRVCEAVDGEHLMHLDGRADNILIDCVGKAWIIDWPWAAVGARWVDGLFYLLDARLRGETVDAEHLLHSHELFAGVPAEEVDAVLAGAIGRWFDQARRPAPPNMPTIRAFQRSEALAGVAWLQERWG